MSPSTSTGDRADRLIPMGKRPSALCPNGPTFRHRLHFPSHSEPVRIVHEGLAGLTADQGRKAGQGLYRIGGQYSPYKPTRPVTLRPPPPSNPESTRNRRPGPAAAGVAAR